MELRALQITISRGLYELGCEDEFAEMVGRFKCWAGTTRSHRVRIWQSLADNTARGFDASLVLIAQRLFAYHGRHDLCDEMTGAMMNARWEGARLREEGQPSREMRLVRHRGKAREVG